MRYFGFLLSFLLHAGLLAVVVFWADVPDRKLELDRPAYTVDLVQLAPAPPPPPGEKSPSKSDATPAKPEPKQVAQPVMQAEKQPMQSSVEPVKPARKPEPKPEAKPISEKTKEKKVVVKKKEKPEPEKKTEPLKKPEKKAEPKPEPKPVPKPKPEPKPKKTSDELLADALSDVKQGVQAEDDQVAAQLDDELAALRQEQGGEIYSHGGTPGGAGSGLAEVYAMIVASAIKENWRYPSFAGDANLLASVELTIGDDGTIVSSEILESSGNIEFDNSTLRAIRETERVEPPSREQDKVIVINFNSQDLNQ